MDGKEDCDKYSRTMTNAEECIRTEGLVCVQAVYIVPPSVAELAVSVRIATVAIR